MGDGIGTVYRHNRLDAADTRPVLRMTDQKRPYWSDATAHSRCQWLQRAEYPEKEEVTYDGNNDLAGGTILQLALFVDRYRSARRAGNHFRLSKTVCPNFLCTALYGVACSYPSPRSERLFPRSWNSSRAGSDTHFWLCPDVLTNVQKTADYHAHALDYRNSSVSGARGNLAHWVCSRPAARSVCSSCRNW